MHLLFFIPALLVFLYALYRLVKDDYIFIRKGVSLEQAFDIAFITSWVGLFISRFLYLVFHLKKGESMLVDFFSFKNSGLSLTGAIIGGIVALYLMSTYKKLPLGRLSDFVSLSFLFALPILFFVNALFVTRNDLLFVFLNAIIYFVLLLFFVQFLYPKIMNRSLKEGMLAILFLLFFSLITLTISFLTSLKNILGFINLENIIVLLLFIMSIILLVKLQGTHSRTGRTMIRS